MQILVTRFHLLLLTVTVALTGVGLFRIPADFMFPAHWAGSAADWLWPRNAMLVAPIIQVVLLIAFFALGNALTKNHYAKTQHIFDPMLTFLMLLVAACQLGLLLTGIGSDLDFIRVTGFGLGAALFLLAVVLFEAERHTYAGLRMPWPIRTDNAWRLVHRVAGIAFGLAAISLATLAWLDAGVGALVVGFAVALIAPSAIAGAVTIATRLR
ncbi:MAG: SdpI/YhfL protein family protein [Devosia sp.]|nr:SdpI/YhfL protein family protein [Devosia sp.]